MTNLETVIETGLAKNLVVLTLVHNKFNFVLLKELKDAEERVICLKTIFNRDQPL